MSTGLLSRVAKRQKVANDGVERTTLSFYKYVRIANPEEFRELLQNQWDRLGCLGRVYVANEGINAQMNVPSKNFETFQVFLSKVPELKDVPLKIAVEEGSKPSFYKLTIRVKKKIVADGLDDTSFDVTDTGAYLSAREFNEYVDDPDALVVDMRNSYESEVGHFENALTPDVDTFRDELKATPELLRVHKNKKIALYCTGGIRCEKASAWLKHNGFENVHHLKGGIIDYKHQVEQEGLENKFHGKNFVFDERLSERISDEIISNCHLCHTNKSDTHYHCKFQPCHVLYLGCEECVEKKHGYCSPVCMALDQLPPKLQKLYARYRNKLYRPKQFRKCKLRK